MTRERPKTFAPAADPLSNLSDFQPKIVRAKPDLKEAEKVAAESGFTARQGQGAPAPEKKVIDARSLRKTARTNTAQYQRIPRDQGEVLGLCDGTGLRDGGGRALDAPGSRQKCFYKVL